MKLIFSEALDEEKFSINCAWLYVPHDCFVFKFLFELKVSSEHETARSIETYTKDHLYGYIFQLRGENAGAQRKNWLNCLTSMYRFFGLSRQTDVWQPRVCLQ